MDDKTINPDNRRGSPTAHCGYKTKEFMIKANELRIGNFIVDDDGALSKVIGFKPYDHSVRCDEEEGCDILIDIHGADGKIRRGYAAESTTVSPIPVTSKWLERCGFVNGAIDREEYWTLEFNETEKFSFTDIGLRYGIQGVAQYEWSKVDHITHLHQLQNLYYWLTGEDLTII